MNAPYNIATGLPEQVSFRGPDLGGLTSRVSAWFARQRKIDQISRTLNRRTDRQLADMGLTREDIPRVARGLPLTTPRAEFDDSVRSAERPVCLLPLALMR